MTELRLRRSELSTPGSSPKMLARAAASEADFVFCDLEDSVAPSQKVEARKNVIIALNDLDWGKKTKAVRINGVHTPWAHDDVIELVTEAGREIDVLIVPKVRESRDMWWVETRLAQLEDKLGLERTIALEVLIEEASALTNVEAIAKCSRRIEALIFGPGDFSASQSVRWNLMRQANFPGDIWLYHRSRIVVAAKAAGIEAVDGPFANFRDADGYRTEAIRAALIGYAGKWAIHPDQIAIANEVFSPTEDEVRSAREIVDAYAKSEAAGEGAAGVGGVMIDAATVRIMEGILQRADLISGRDASGDSSLG